MSGLIVSLLFLYHSVIFSDWTNTRQFAPGRRGNVYGASAAGYFGYGDDKEDGANLQKLFSQNVCSDDFVAVEDLRSGVQKPQDSNRRKFVKYRFFNRQGALKFFFAALAISERLAGVARVPTLCKCNRW